MLLSKEVLAVVNARYRQRKAIIKAVELAKMEREDPHGRPSSGGYVRPDPTGNLAALRLAEVPRVEVQTERGVRVTVYRPERWLSVMAAALTLYRRSAARRARLASEIVNRRYGRRERPLKTSVMMGISRATYFNLLNEFLSDTAALAFKEGLLDGVAGADDAERQQ